MYFVSARLFMFVKWEREWTTTAQHSKNKLTSLAIFCVFSKIKPEKKDQWKIYELTAAILCGHKNWQKFVVWNVLYVKRKQRIKTIKSAFLCNASDECKDYERTLMWITLEDQPLWSHSGLVQAVNFYFSDVWFWYQNRNRYVRSMWDYMKLIHRFNDNY